jgi:hypothetical protein
MHHEIVRIMKPSDQDVVAAKSDLVGAIQIAREAARDPARL